MTHFIPENNKELQSYFDQQSNILNKATRESIRQYGEASYHTKNPQNGVYEVGGMRIINKSQIDDISCLERITNSFNDKVTITLNMHEQENSEVRKQQLFLEKKFVQRLSFEQFCFLLFVCIKQCEEPFSIENSVTWELYSESSFLESLTVNEEQIRSLMNRVLLPSEDNKFREVMETYISETQSEEGTYSFFMTAQFFVAFYPLFKPVE